MDETQTPPVDPTTPVTPAVDNPTPADPAQTAAEIEANQQPAQTPVQAQPEPQPEALLQKFLSGEAVGVHSPISVEIAPLVVNKVEAGGVIVMPSNNLLVKYKNQ